MKRSNMYGLIVLLLTACSNQDSVTSTTPELYPDQASTGFQQFSKQCSTCHRPPMPNQHTAMEWESVVSVMQRHRAQAGYGAMPDDVKQQVLAYLQSHSQSVTHP